MYSHNPLSTKKNPITPCGLDCERCVNNGHSVIRLLATSLLHELGNFSDMACIFAKDHPAFEDYPAFARFLKCLSEADCAGCRSGGHCLVESCIIRPCIAEHGIEFCYQCPEFPCKKHGLSKDVEKLWLKNNRKLKELGPVAYLEDKRSKPSY